MFGLLEKGWVFLSTRCFTNVKVFSKVSGWFPGGIYPVFIPKVPFPTGFQVTEKKRKKKDELNRAIRAPKRFTVDGFLGGFLPKFWFGPPEGSMVK